MSEVCPICHESFENRAGLGSHMSHKHPDAEMPEKEEESRAESKRTKAREKKERWKKGSDIDEEEEIRELRKIRRSQALINEIQRGDGLKEKVDELEEKLDRTIALLETLAEVSGNQSHYLARLYKDQDRLNEIEDVPLYTDVKVLGD